jgi:hypothetical protein
MKIGLIVATAGLVAGGAYVAFRGRPDGLPRPGVNSVAAEEPAALAPAPAAEGDEGEAKPGPKPGKTQQEVYPEGTFDKPAFTKGKPIPKSELGSAVYHTVPPDINNDGWPDLLLVHGGTPTGGPRQLYISNKTANPFDGVAPIILPGNPRLFCVGRTDRTENVWKFQMHWHVCAGVAIANGCLFLPANDLGLFYCFKLDAPGCTSPAIMDGKVEGEFRRSGDPLGPAGSPAIVGESYLYGMTHEEMVSVVLEVKLADSALVKRTFPAGLCIGAPSRRGVLHHDGREPVRAGRAQRGRGTMTRGGSSRILTPRRSAPILCRRKPVARGLHRGEGRGQEEG